MKSFLKDDPTIETKETQASIGQLLQKKLVVKKSDYYLLSEAGKKVGKGIRIERMSKGYDDLLGRTQASEAYSMFCERVFGKDLSQFNVLDMEQLDTLIEFSDLKPGEAALDLGCGNGRIAEYISDVTGARVVGLDFASKAIERSLKRTSEKRERLNYVIGNIDELSFEDGSFDVIISIDSLYFVDNIESTVKELRRLLRPSSGRMGIFFDQSCAVDESREILLSENTNVGKALRNNHLTYHVVDFTSNSREIWIREIEAAEELKESFVKEGNTTIYEDRAKDARQTLELIEDGRHVRYFYLAKFHG